MVRRDIRARSIESTRFCALTVLDTEFELLLSCHTVKCDYKCDTHVCHICDILYSRL